MSTKDEVREFLMTRRALVAWEQAEIPRIGEQRVPGLRREEAAMLAGGSLDYDTRLERGNIGGASKSILSAIAHSLHLDNAEREYLFDLARTTPSTPAAARALKPTATAMRASMQRVLDNMTVPAIVHNAAQDIVTANLMGCALYALVRPAGRYDLPRRHTPAVRRLSPARSDRAARRPGTTRRRRTHPPARRRRDS